MKSTEKLEALRLFIHVIFFEYMGISYFRKDLSFNLFGAEDRSDSLNSSRHLFEGRLCLHHDWKKIKIIKIIKINITFRITHSKSVSTVHFTKYQGSLLHSMLETVGVDLSTLIGVFDHVFFTRN